MTGYPTTTRIAAAAAILALSLSACGGAPPPPAPSGAGGATTVAAVDTAAVDAFCSADVDLESAFNSAPPLEALPPEAVEGAVAQLKAAVEPLLGTVEDLAPEAVQTAVTTLATTARGALSTMDFAAFDTPQVRTADDDLDAWMIDNCGFEQVEVTATDFEYQGIPESLTAGEKAVTLTNEGTNLHEIAVLRINDDVTLPAEELLALPMEEAIGKVTIKGITFADPGGDDTSFLRLDEPGRYIAVCFIPEGTTTGAEGAGPPHFTLGMLAEITVS